MSTPDDVLAINPDAAVTVEHIGRGNHKVVMADQFYKFPENLLQLALVIKLALRDLSRPIGLVIKEVSLQTFAPPLSSVRSLIHNP